MQELPLYTIVDKEFLIPSFVLIRAIGEDGLGGLVPNKAIYGNRKRQIP